MKAINPGHFLLTCRLDNWVHLLEENHFHIARDRLPQALYISATALALAPAAAAESLIYRKRIRETKIEKDPIFILGHWRSGTTYLQNVLSRDEQFGWFDPVNTIGLPYSLLLGRLIQPPIEKGIQNGRPQDNVQYSLDLPMEETFGVLTISPYSIIHMIAFPENYKKYIEGAFVSDLPVEELRKWERSYDYAVRKLTYIKKGKQLILKSPDNTARIRELWGMYPDARFINIHRDPYKTVRSTIHMFRTEMDSLRLTEEPDNIDELIENTVIDIFERMYRELFELEGGGYVCDTAGFSSVDCETSGFIVKENLQFDFREFAPFIGKCKFSSCTHTCEKGCEICRAVERGEISKSRHDSYVALYKEAEAVKDWQRK